MPVPRIWFLARSHGAASWRCFGAEAGTEDTLLRENELGSPEVTSWHNQVQQYI